MMATSWILLCSLLWAKVFWSDGSFWAPLISSVQKCDLSTADILNGQCRLRTAVVSWMICLKRWNLNGLQWPLSLFRGTTLPVAYVQCWDTLIVGWYNNHCFVLSDYPMRMSDARSCVTIGVCANCSKERLHSPSMSKSQTITFSQPFSYRLDFFSNS